MNLQEQILAHFRVWSTVGVAKLASVGLEEINTIASIVALLCGAFASLAIAYKNIKKK